MKKAVSPNIDRDLEKGTRYGERLCAQRLHATLRFNSEVTLLLTFGLLDLEEVPALVFIRASSHEPKDLLDEDIQIYIDSIIVSFL